MGTSSATSAGSCKCCRAGCCPGIVWPTTLYVGGTLLSGGFCPTSGITVPITFTFLGVSGGVATYTATTSWSGPGTIAWTLKLSCDVFIGGSDCSAFLMTLQAIAEVYQITSPPTCPSPGSPVWDSGNILSGSTCSCDPLSLVFNVTLETETTGSQLTWCLCSGAGSGTVTVMA
jgi:hypothetical protein